jgi:adenosine deaminase
MVPKVELHLHLEGAIPHDALWELVRKYGGDPATPNLTALRQRFQFRDFAHFIETWVWKNQFLREYEDFTFVAEAVARDLARQNIRYAEMFYSPSDFFRHGLKTQRLAEAIRSGLALVPDIKIAMVCDLVRDRGPENGLRVLMETSEVMDLDVVGITIGGSEQDYPPQPFAEVYELARKLGFHTSAHAGEAAGPESIWASIEELKVERIGHGTRAAEDERLLDYLAETRIPLEVCPLSNVRTGVVRSVDKHPVKDFFDRGLAVTISTDDPGMFGNSLAQEYEVLVDRLNFSREQIRSLIVEGIQASWLSHDEKQRMVEEFCSDRNWEG